MKVVLELTKPQAETLREAVRYFADEMAQSAQRNLVAERVLDKVDEALR